MDVVPTHSLMKEVSESFLLFAVAGFTLAGYLGLAFILVGVMR